MTPMKAEKKSDSQKCGRKCRRCGVVGEIAVEVM